MGSGSARVAALLFWALLACGGCGAGGNADSRPIVVNSLQDLRTPPGDTVTLRSAIQAIPPGGRIVFDGSLDGRTIELGIVETDNSVLKGEIYDNTMRFVGYGERNYGKSALYAAKALTIDASALPHGITLRWAGGDASPARVLAVYGDLTMKNVSVTGGYSSAEPIAGGAQPYTLARGGGLAVWGTATLDRCTVYGNRCAGDNAASRDRGTYGGGIFANGLVLTNCVVSGNAVLGSGAAGGGIYSVGGSDGPGIDSTLDRCTVSGNRVTAQFAYGGGIFTLGGGPNYLKSLRLTNCTVARNVVEDHPDLPQIGEYYYRGGGVYMGGGYLSVAGCTIAENRVTGSMVIFHGKPNMGGGGIAATVGNAHVVEDITIRHSVVVGNTLNGGADDLFTGSVLQFYSHGYNLIGRIDFSQILVPIPPWASLSRKHWPKAGDFDDVAISDALDVAGAVRHVSVVSAGTDSGQHALLWYPPTGRALDQIPAGGNTADNIVMAEYSPPTGANGEFLRFVLDTLDTNYAGILGSGFGTSYGTAFEATYGVPVDNIAWYMDPARWPSDAQNIPWINFWRGLDNAIGGSLGTVRLGDAFWGSFGIGRIRITDNIVLSVTSSTLGPFRPSGPDQLGNPRPNGAYADIGAIER